MNSGHSFSEAEIAAALEACALEPVHIPGAIQPGGCLVSLDEDMRQVRQVSANLQDLLDISVADALAGSASELLGERLIAQLRHELTQRERLPGALSAEYTVQGEQRQFHAAAYRSGSRVVVELEPLDRFDEHRLMATVDELLRQLADLDDPERLLEALTRNVQRLTGYDRVMIYRFDEQWNGRVVAEHCRPEAESFLGHHFPASDIPAQVRRLYDINPVRSIPDAGAQASPLVPACDPHDDEPLDLSLGALRAVSPIHQAYLHNMGVGASLSIAMHDEQRLWGLLACHGLQPRPLSAAVRDAASALVQISVPRLMLLRARTEASLLQSVHDSRDLLAGERGKPLDPEAMLQRHGQQWLNLLRASGVALVHNGRASGVGRLPAAARLLAIADWLSQHQRHDTPWHTQALSKTSLVSLQEDDLCGLLAAPLPSDGPQPGWLMLFRPEQRETRRWAGRPEHVFEAQEGQLILSPRRSFAEWQEEVRGRSRAWSTIESRAAADLAEDLAVLTSSHEIAQLNERLNEANRKLKTLAYTDGLTGVWNRYRTEQAIDANISAARRYSRPCSLLLLDVDHFKDFNDVHGHEAGDRVLVELCQVLQRRLRPTDTLGRWGGEEFIVLADNTDLTGAAHLAERLRQSAEGLQLPELGPVSISLGVAAWRTEDNRKRLVARADQAMYRAKQAGRNRVEQEDPAD